MVEGVASASSSMKMKLRGVAMMLSADVMLVRGPLLDGSATDDCRSIDIGVFVTEKPARITVFSILALEWARHGAEQFTEDLAVIFYGCHLDRTIPEITAAIYCLMPSLLHRHYRQVGDDSTRN